jgi:hypothetical protein
MGMQRVYLTDITLHVREHRQTGSFAKVAEKGRMYSPLPKDYGNKKTPIQADGTFCIDIELPPDLKAQVERGEVEVMIPDGGLPIYAGRDVYEFTERMRLDKHRADVHGKWGAKAWRDKKMGV